MKRFAHAAKVAAFVGLTMAAALLLQIAQLSDVQGYVFP